MKRRLLSMVMAFAMVLSLIPAVYAADADGSDLVDLLPGNETVKEAFEKLLDGGIPGNQDSIQEIRDLIDKEYNRPRSTAGYVVDENSYYVSLGDSTVTGMSTGDPAYNNFGYKTKVPTCAPYQVAQALGLDINAQYEQLALAGLRVTDLRYVLDKSFVPDQYTLTRTKSRVDHHAGGFAQMRNDYMTALPKADLITVCIGNCNFTDFMSAQIFGKVSEVLSTELAPWLSNKYIGARVREAVEQYVDLEDRPYEMNWKGYIGAEGVVQLNAALAEVKAKLIAEGFPEIYEVDAADLMEISIPQGMIVINIPVVDMAVYCMECLLYGYVTFAVDLEATFHKIREIAPDAELLVLSMYNPTDELVFTFNGKEIPYGEYYGVMAKALSLYFLDYAEAAPKTTFVDIYDTESAADAELKKTGSTYELMDYIMEFAANSADFHATPAGHGYMKDQILAALAPEAEGLLGDADGSGEVDYLDAMIVLQYHTGVIGEEELELRQCDVDKSGEVDYLDAMMILQYHTGVIGEF